MIFKESFTKRREDFELDHPKSIMLFVLFEVLLNLILFGYIAPFLWNSVRPALMSSKPVGGMVLFKTSILVSIIIGSIRLV